MPKRTRYRGVGGEVWYRGPGCTEWKRWDNAVETSKVPPPRWFRGSSLSSAASTGLPALVVGVVAVLVAFGLAIAKFDGADNVASVLAPVLTAIGAFTGHAAGHAAAKR